MHPLHALADTPLRALGVAVARARQQAGLTKTALARTSGLSRLTIAQLEAGTYPDLGIRKVQRVLAVLGLRIRVEERMTVARAPGPTGVALVKGARRDSRLARLFATRALERRGRALELATRTLKALRRAGVTSRVVGSLAKDAFRADSDVDFLIEDRAGLAESRVVAIVERSMAGFPFDVTFAERMDPRLLAIVREEARRGASVVRAA
jgi:transcriptional regulator with XRE-family HTH domain